MGIFSQAEEVQGRSILEMPTYLTRNDENNVDEL
jgi:hypothetical protein